MSNSGNRRGWNLKRGHPHGDRGRREGASLGGLAVQNKDVPEDCPVCQRNGYTTWAQHIGHMGFKAVADKLGLTPAQLFRHLLAMTQDPNPENGAWQQWIQQAWYDEYGKESSEDA